MNRPEINEEKLNKLMSCLVRDFEKKYQARTDKLITHKFWMTDRMGCAKESGLNFEYITTTKPDKDVVKILASEYTSAVKTLIDRGLLEALEKEPLAFRLTKEGFSQVKRKEAKENRTKLQKVLDFCKANKNAIALVVGILTFLGAVIGAILKYT
jgi:hypothetical protein